MEPGAGREATVSPVVGAVSPVAAAASPAAGAASLAAGAGATSAAAGVAASPGAGVASLVVYGCCAWPLSLDARCAHEARLVFREAASGLGLPDDLIYDGTTMASELAANTLYAQENVQFEGAARAPVAGGPALWPYLPPAAGLYGMVSQLFSVLAGL